MTSITTKPSRRAEIVAAAGALFSESGYHGTSMRDLAKRTDLQGSSLYAHFGSKDDLLWAIVDNAASAFNAAADAVPQLASPSETLAALIEAHLRVIRTELPYATVFFHDWTRLTSERRKHLIEMRDAYQQRFRSVIEEGVRRGEFAVDDVDLACLVVLSALNYSYQWLDPHGRLDHDELAAAFAKQLLGGLWGTDSAHTTPETELDSEVRR